MKFIERRGTMATGTTVGAALDELGDPEDHGNSRSSTCNRGSKIEPFPDFSPSAIFDAERPPPQPSRPEDFPSPEEMQASLTEEMNQMSPKDREEILNDIHAVPEQIEETPELVELTLLMMQQNLDQLELRAKWDINIKKEILAYLTARERDESFVNNRSFRLMFLRRDKFDSVLAAGRLLHHLTIKLEMFGEDKIAKEITIEDLEEDVIKAFESQSISFFPFRDVSGRAILRIEPARREFHKMESLIKVYWLMAMSSLRETTTQKNGVVCIIINMDSNCVDHMIFTELFTYIGNAIPIRSACNHYCVSISDALVCLPFARYYSLKSCRTRFRHHVGTPTELHQSLKTYGIFITSFVIPCRAEMRMIRTATAHQIQLRIPASRTRQEEGGKTSTEKAILKPNEHDVCFGKGKSRYHTGNLRAQNLVNELYDEYHKSSRGNKTRIVSHVLKTIQDAGGRFLRPAIEVLGDEGIGKGYVVVGDAMAKEKLGKFFRKRPANSNDRR